ncbi:MAG TPA: GspH/FimT family pseudopilin [Rhizomicrobium sp.]|nr:GspH/FimT family pseudopilin [Rhizomicrobium sp.]
MWAAGSPDRGTTLIEALAVLAIAAIIATIAFPRVQSMIAQAMFRQSESVVLAEIRTAHAAAMRNGAPVTFDVSDDGSQFGLNQEMTHRLPAGYVLSLDSSGALTFYPDGTASGGNVTLTGAARSLAVAVDPDNSAVAAVTP